MAGQRLQGTAWQLDTVWVLQVRGWTLWLGKMSREVVQGQEARWESVERRGERLGGRGGPAVGEVEKNSSWLGWVSCATVEGSEGASERASSSESTS